MKSEKNAPVKSRPEPVNPIPQIPSKPAPISNLMIRLVWLLYGNAAIAICWFSIAGRGIRKIDVADFVYFGLVALIVLMRFIDISHYNGLTAEGKPATMVDFRRYTLILVSICIGLWFLAQAIAFYKWL